MDDVTAFTKAFSPRQVTRAHWADIWRDCRMSTPGFGRDNILWLAYAVVRAYRSGRIDRY